MAFYPNLWGKKTLNKMKKEQDTKRRIYNTVTDYTEFVEGEHAAGYSGPKIGAVSAVNLPASASDVNDPEKSSIDILFNQHKGVPFIVKNIDAVQQNVNMMEHYTDEAKDAIQDCYDEFCLNGMITEAGTKIKKSDTTNNKVVKADIVKLINILDKKKAPEKNRYLVISADVKSDMLDIEDFISRDKNPNASTMKDGVIGTILGLDVILNTSITKVNASGLIDETPANNTKDVLVAYQKLGWGFGRQQEFGAMDGPSPLEPGTLVNIWSYYGGTKQEPDFIVTMRDN